jgi:dynein heavy chain 1, cytosolic
MVISQTSTRVKADVPAVGRTTFVYYLTTEYSAGPTTIASVAIIKRSLPLDPSIPLQSQLQIVNLPGGPTRPGQDAVSPYESLHSLVRLAIAPYFDSYTRGGEGDQTVRRGKNIDEAKTGILVYRLTVDT